MSLPPAEGDSTSLSVALGKGSEQMALVSRLDQISMARNGVHEKAECTYTIFQDDRGQAYLQIDTYGTEHRQFRGKKSQSVQFGPEALAQLRDLLTKDKTLGAL
jgi:hypothetical protein